MNESMETAVDAVTIRNKDIFLLQEVLPVMQLVEKTEELRVWERARAAKMTANITGMPRGCGGLDLDGVIAALDELDRDQARECLEYTQILRRAQKVLNGIESRSMRAFVMMKYVMGASDREVRKELNMTRRGFDRARRSVEDAPDMATVKWKERYIMKAGAEGL